METKILTERIMKIIQENINSVGVPTNKAIKIIEELLDTDRKERSKEVNKYIETQIKSQIKYEKTKWSNETYRKEHEKEILDDFNAIKMIVNSNTTDKKGYIKRILQIMGLRLLEDKGEEVKKLLEKLNKNI